MKLKKIKLNFLSDVDLQDCEMKMLKGGERVCGCACPYEDKGGSTMFYNGVANIALGNDGGTSPDKNTHCYIEDTSHTVDKSMW